MHRKRRSKLVKQIDETIKLPNKTGNGILKFLVKTNEQGQLHHYSLAYINPRLCATDNGRVLGYDNSHGYHHRHYMGTVESVEFTSYEAVAEKFEREWRALHDTLSGRHR